VQPVATCRQSPYLHKPAIVIVTSFSWCLAPTALAVPVLIMTSFSLWLHSLLGSPRPLLWRYGHLTAFNTIKISTYPRTFSFRWHYFTAHRHIVEGVAKNFCLGFNYFSGSGYKIFFMSHDLSTQESRAVAGNYTAGFRSLVYRKLAPKPRAMQWTEISLKYRQTWESCRKTTSQVRQWSIDACRHMVSRDPRTKVHTKCGE